MGPGCQELMDGGLFSFSGMCSSPGTCVSFDRMPDHHVWSSGGIIPQPPTSSGQPFSSWRPEAGSSSAPAAWARPSLFPFCVFPLVLGGRGPQPSFLLPSDGTYCKYLRAFVLWLQELAVHAPRAASDQRPPLGAGGSSASMVTGQISDPCGLPSLPCLTPLPGITSQGSSLHSNL